ncbi:MAG: FAD-binding oxidoreductase [Candidatus Kapaibacteriota bacterium]
MLIKTESDQIQNYLTDSSNLKGFCEKVYIPEDSQELVELIKECYRDNIPYTISAGGTGLVGGRVPFGGVLISTEKLNKIIDFDEEHQTILVESGVVRKDLDEYLESRGFFLPPNPTETNSFVGGNVACDSSGARTFKYGTIRDYVLGLEVVLPSGVIVTLERDNINLVTNSHFSLSFPDGSKIEFEIPALPWINTSKNTAGYYLHKGMHLLDLFIGSEGTLGTITKIKFKVLRIPENVLGFIIFFEDLDRSLDFIAETRVLSKQSSELQCENIKISPRLIEFFDKNSLSLISDTYPDIPSVATCAIWIEQESLHSTEDELLSLWLEHIKKFTNLSDRTWVAINEAQHRKFAQFRHLIPVRVFEIVSKTNYQKIGSDVAVNDWVFKNYFHQVLSKLEKSNLQYFIWGHFGNSHIHLNIIPRNHCEDSLARKIFDWHVQTAIQLGGTYSAEHGTGKLKRKYLEWMYGKDLVEKMKNIKLAFDPKNLIGRGTLFF